MAPVPWAYQVWGQTIRTVQKSTNTRLTEVCWYPGLQLGPLLSMPLKSAMNFRRTQAVRRAERAEAGQGESPHRVHIGRSILYRQEGKKTYTCVIPSSLQTGME